MTFEANYLDYTAESNMPELPANSAQAGVYVKIAPLQLSLVVVAVVAIIYGLNTTPLVFEIDLCQNETIFLTCSAAEPGQASPLLWLSQRDRGRTE